MDNSGDRVPEEDDEGKTVVFSQRSELLDNARRSDRPPSSRGTKDSATRIRNAPVVVVPYSDLVEDEVDEECTTVLEPRALDDLKSSMAKAPPLLPPRPSRGTHQAEATEDGGDQDQTTVWNPEPEEPIPKSDEITRRPFQQSLSAPAPEPIPQQHSRSDEITGPPARRVLEPQTQRAIIRSEAPRTVTTVFSLGMLVGFLIAVAMCLAVLLFLVSSGRAAFSL
jgi:hypothetical protein